MKKNFNWCFIGAGTIARKVAKDTQDICIGSVWSRTMQNAQAFADEFGGTPYADIKQAINHPSIDGVYIAAQHPEHMECAIMALREGKPVLCEKPLAVNAAQAQAMVDAAREMEVYFAEAMWTRFNPIIRTVRDWIAQGEIGEAHYLTADFAGVNEDDGKKYHFRQERAGGSLLDVGVYAVSLAQMVFGMPEDIAVQSTVREGIDYRMAMQLRFAQGNSAALFSAFDTHGLSTAQIHGDKGTITIPDFWQAREAFLRRKNGENLQVRRDGCIGWGYMMKAVEEEILRGAKESSDIKLSDSMEVMQTMDMLRRVAKIKYSWD